MRRKIAFFCLALVVAFLAVRVTPGQTAPEEGPRIITYELRNPGRVSTAIFDTKGRLVRELLHADINPPQAVALHLMTNNRSQSPGWEQFAGLLRTPVRYQPTSSLSILAPIHYCWADFSGRGQQVRPPAHAVGP